MGGRVGPIVDHPDGFAGLAAGVPRTAGPSTAVDDGSPLSPILAVTLAGTALLGLGLLAHRRLRRVRPLSGAAGR